MSPESDRALREESRHWPPVNGGQRVRCPLCDAKGYPGEAWVLGHRAEAHEDCDECGQTFTKRGIGRHKNAAHPS